MKHSLLAICLFLAQNSFAANLSAFTEPVPKFLLATFTDSNEVMGGVKEEAVCSANNLPSNTKYVCATNAAKQLILARLCVDDRDEATVCKVSLARINIFNEDEVAAAKIFRNNCIDFQPSGAVTRLVSAGSTAPDCNYQPGRRY